MTPSPCISLQHASQQHETPSDLPVCKHIGITATFVISVAQDITMHRKVHRYGGPPIQKETVWSSFAFALSDLRRVTLEKTGIDWNVV